MEIPIDVKRLITRSFDAARAACSDDHLQEMNKRKLHAARSKHFVAALAGSLRAAYKARPDLRVCRRGDEANRPLFGVTEFLYDITVLQSHILLPAGTGPAGNPAASQIRATPIRKVPVYSVVEVLWQIESELEVAPRNTVQDFNKLVAGSARNKLFIGPVELLETYDKDLLLPVARACRFNCVDVNVYLAFVPAPKNWGAQSAASTIIAWHLAQDRWTPL